MPILTLGVIAGAIAVFWASNAYFRSEALDKASARLSLYQSTVTAELRRVSHLPHVLAKDRFVIETASGAATKPLDARLADFARRASVDAIYLMDLTGLTRSASNAGTPGSFLGQNYGFRPYFNTAMQGGLGEFYGIGATTGVPGYFFAEAVSNDLGETLGVVAIKIDLSALQDSWQRAGERVILANDDGVVLLSSIPDWRYRVLNPLTDTQRTRIEAARQFGQQTLAPLDWSRQGMNVAQIAGQRFLYLETKDLPNDWSLHYFASNDEVLTRTWLATGLFALLSGGLFIALQVQRTRRIRIALTRSEQEEVLLRATNERLAIEIEDRKAAERQLQKTQTELERASRLAALGQLAASVTHELGQPIAAMRNHLTAAELTTSQTTLTSKLGGLVDRMEGITRQLKFFARSGREDFERVDLSVAMHAALDLISPSISERGVQIIFDPPKGVTLSANQLRIEQVMTNLLRNALDALDETAAPRIEIAIGADDGAVWFEVADNGHGLGDHTLDDLREPFATSRESGQGMGLGLTISARIVDDHGGEMTAQNRPNGGAVFRVQFPRVAEVHAA
ncbi:MAG: ATP-binding protein [Pseudomonadota bacterium]